MRDPTTVPTMIATIVEPSIKPFARTSAVVLHELGQDSVLRGPVDGRADADERVSRDRLYSREHQPGARGLEHVADQEHLRLRTRVGERADPRREHDERDEERALQRGHVPRAARRIDQHRDRGEQDRVVGERGQELRAEQNEDAAVQRRLARLAAAPPRRAPARPDSRPCRCRAAGSSRLGRCVFGTCSSLMPSARARADRSWRAASGFVVTSTSCSPFCASGTLTTACCDVGPGARRELLDRRERHHLAADLREALRAALDRDEALRVDRHDVARVVPTRAALGRRAAGSRRACRASR